ncbi:hypothetical protein [Mycolicibacterium goodii]|uniref:Uncharacterized protein n=1 Tax=Mycolicibacterium goodii TaxID=134601 RepID=A0A0K0X9C2_MYCGD|nr:hypothetical protein AFA91_21135 [Mycolicibacterium goodii]
MAARTGSTNPYGWRRAVPAAVAGGALAAGLLIGAAAPTAFAVPSTKENDAPVPQISPDEVLAQIANEYATGRGGGQVSNLIHDVMKLRQQGYRPSNSNATALAEALDKRPNQTPLVDALKSTLAYQRKLQAQSQAAVTGGGVTGGINQVPPGMPFDPANPNNTGVFLGPSGGIALPVG